jgi:hypothetical protein
MACRSAIQLGGFLFMIDRQEMLLIQLMEEAGEVVQAASNDPT